ncbi:Peptidase M16 inactive domain protein [Falsiruegeria litorea R37]|uniref:Peptidase M16 inactive domain protein n=1 Tax=Falsiruegeria litorea R37 TaxID=1200284 RepID=A0A1Y5TCX7_9RHOB|nr:pitrilysin family protein [Falsiruegeria litorea]SLN60887.1 Peptidase M16 inactive domain protein [Falsiruegeria litorea R37]
MKLFLSTITALVLALPAWAEVKIQEVTSQGGINAWLVEEHSIPFTALEIRFRGGTSLDAAGKRGATNLMMGLIEEGAGDLDARAYAKELESLAASFSYSADDDSVSISAKFLTENRDEVIDLLRTTLHQPRFDQDAIDRVRAQVISGLKSDAKDPNTIAGEAFSAMAFGDHPYATDGKGTIESVTALTRDDIVAAHKGAFALDRIYVGAVGDISAEELGTLLDELLADLPGTGAPIPGKADVTIDGGVTVVDFVTPQSVALFGHSGIDRDDEDFFAAYILNHILGAGSFESRLMAEVREKRGLTYGVYSYLVPKDLASIYLGSVASGNARIAEAIDVIRAEWIRMAEDGVTEEELEDAKTYLTGAYPLRFDGNARIAGIMVGMQMQDLPIDYIATRNDKVNAVTLEDIKRVAGELLKPEELHFVVVGQPEGLETTN